MQSRVIAGHEPYFYARDEVLFYDDTARLTDRAYDLVHDIAVRVLAVWLAQHFHETQSGSAPLILDAGCGTGAEAMQILLRIPHARLVCVDNSRAMLHEFRKKVERAYCSDSADGRVAFVEADFREPDWLDFAIAESGLTSDANEFAAAISVYAMHHLSPADKQDVYRSIHRHLRPRAIFANADLFSFASPWLASLAQEEEENWITNHFDRANSGSLAAVLGSHRDQLRDAWLRHIRFENALLPIAPPSDLDAHNPISETCLLQKAGFKYIDVPARLYQSAVLLAVKDATPDA